MKGLKQQKCFIDFRDLYDEGRGFDYLDAVGGADAKGLEEKAYIIPNGRGGCGEFILVFTNYPKVTLVRKYCSKTGS
jgi:hypothetical protein